MPAQNLTTAEIIEKGIALQEDCSTKHAAEFFKQKMIDMDTATRVLLRHARRRNYRTIDTIDNVCRIE